MPNTDSAGKSNWSNLIGIRCNGYVSFQMNKLPTNYFNSTERIFSQMQIYFIVLAYYFLTKSLISDIERGEKPPAEHKKTASLTKTQR